MSGQRSVSRPAAEARPVRWVSLAVLVVAVLVGLELMAGGAAAQSSGAGGAGATEAAEAEGVLMGEGVPTIAELFMQSPWINGILAGLSVLALVLFLYLLLSLSSGSFNPPQFTNDVTKLILNRQYDQAIHYCQNNGHLFASTIVQRLVENRDKEPAVLMEILNAEGRRRGEGIWNRVGYLAEISNIAPMLGLLGTVLGMIKVFFTLNTRVVGQTAGQLSEGIAEAMGTTLFGLVVAIAAGMFYTIAKGRATAALADAEQACHTLADHTHRAENGQAAPGAAATVDV